MKNWNALLLCALLCLAHVWALEGGEREEEVENGVEPLECDVSAECTALASLNIFVNGPGSCSGIARADCIALAAAFQDCDAPIREVIELEECTPQDITRAAECYAAAVAFVFAKAYVAIECEGSGVGCGFAHGNGEAWACTIAAALVDLQVSVGAEQAVCQATISAMAGVFAAVAANVQAEVCVADGFEEDFEVEFGLQAVSIIAEALATCWVDCTDGMATAETTGTSTVSASPTEIDGGADVSVGGTFALPCNPFDDPECLAGLIDG